MDKLRVTVRPNRDRCHLAQFWQPRRFNLYSEAGTAIYLLQGDTLHFDRLGSFHDAIGSSSSSFNWATVPVKQAPPLCYGGVLYRLG